jgi:hypothetical protein
MSIEVTKTRIKEITERDIAFGVRIENTCGDSLSQNTYLKFTSTVWACKSFTTQPIGNAANEWSSDHNPEGAKE